MITKYRNKPIVREYQVMTLGPTEMTSKEVEVWSSNNAYKTDEGNIVLTEVLEEGVDPNKGYLIKMDDGQFMYIQEEQFQNFLATHERV